MTTAIDDHLCPLVAEVAAFVRIGKRLLWGNIASSAAVAFRTMEGLLGRWVQPLGYDFMRLAPAAMHGQGQFLELDWVSATAGFGNEQAAA